jgi:hypothetical protein
MSLSTHLRLAFGTTLILASTAASAAFITPGFAGNTQFDGWANLSVTHPDVAGAGFPSFPGATPWPNPIGSEVAGSGDATFNKVSGLGYPAGFSIYASPFGNGVFTVNDSTVVANIETVLFQIEIGSGSLPQTLSADPTLTINGTTHVGLFSSAVLSSGIQNTGFGPVNVDTLAFQWDLRGLGSITSIAVGFAPAGTSTTITKLQLDQSDTFSAAVAPVPVPAAIWLLGSALVGATGIARRRRNA